MRNINVEATTEEAAINQALKVLEGIHDFADYNCQYFITSDNEDEESIEWYISSFEWNYEGTEINQVRIDG